MQNADARKCPIDFDHNSEAHSKQGPLGIYRSLRRDAPVAWSANNGGYWIISGYEEVSEAASKPEIFSSALSIDHDGPHGGIFIPAEKGLVPMVPTEVDQPLWHDYRKIFARHFSPAAVAAMRPMIAELTTKHVDRVIASGACDMVMDLAAPVPASGILRLLGMEVDEWALYAEPFHNALAYAPGTPEFQAALAGLHGIVERIRRLIVERRLDPGADLLSAVLSATVSGERIDDEQATAVVYTLFSGGVDTTTTFLANAFIHLSRYPADRQALIDEPGRIRLATEEMMRYCSPVQALGRTVTTQTLLGGQTLQAGDRVLLVWASANRDEKVFADADRCNLDRYPNRHVGFGMGIHRCVGSHFARAQIEIMLREVLQRMPDFLVDERLSRQYPNIGIVNGWVNMPASFTPGL